MIEVKFCGTASDVHNEMRDFLGLSVNVGQVAEPEKPKATRSTKATKSDDAPTAASEAAVSASNQTPKASTSVSNADNTPQPTDLRKDARALGTKLIDANMAEQLKAVFAEFGATKFPEIADGKLPAFMIRCEELLAAVEG